MRNYLWLENGTPIDWKHEREASAVYVSLRITTCNFKSVSCKRLNQSEYVRIPADLLLCERTEILLGKPDHKKCTCNHIVDLSIFIKQWTVPWQTQQLAFVIADDGGIRQVQRLNANPAEND